MGRWKNEDLEAFADLKQAGVSAEEIADLLGKPLATVQAKLGISPERPQAATVAIVADVAPVAAGEVRYVTPYGRRGKPSREMKALREAELAAGYVLPEKSNPRPAPAPKTPKPIPTPSIPLGEAEKPVETPLAAANGEAALSTRANRSTIAQLEATIQTVSENARQMEASGFENAAATAWALVAVRQEKLAALRGQP